MIIYCVIGSVRLALVDTSYVVYLTFVKNKLHRDSLKRPNKLEGKLEDLEINQMVNSKGFDKIKL